jgi:hypothetical protein
MLIDGRKDNCEDLFINGRITLKCVYFVIAQAHKTPQYNVINKLNYLLKKYYTNMSFGAIYPRNGTQRQALGNRTYNCLKLVHDHCTPYINENGFPFTPIYNPPDCITRQAMYVQRNSEARSCKHCCRGKAISITYSECMFVTFCIQHKMLLRHIVICGLPGSTICIVPTLSHKRQDFREKNVIERKKCVSTSL